MLELSRFDFVLLRLQTRRLKCESRLDRSRIAPTSLFRPSEGFSSHFAADHLSLHTAAPRPRLARGALPSCRRVLDYLGAALTPDELRRDNLVLRAVLNHSQG